MKLHFTKPDQATLERYVTEETPLLAVTEGVLVTGIISGYLIRCPGFQEDRERPDALYFLTYDHAQYEYASLSGLLEAAFNADDMSLTIMPPMKETCCDPIHPTSLLDFDGIPVDI